MNETALIEEAPTTGVPCRGCSGPVLRERTADGFFKGAGHHYCRDCRDAREAAEIRKREAWKASLGYPIKHRYIEGVKVPVTCACGCGTEINADTIQILELRNIGWTYRKIAAELGRREYAIRQRVRSMPRYAKGHLRNDSREWVDLPCFRCGQPVHTPKNTQFPHCSGRTNCVDYRNGDFARIYDLKEERRKERERANFRAADALMQPHRERRREQRREAILVERRARFQRREKYLAECRAKRIAETEVKHWRRLERAEDRAFALMERERIKLERAKERARLRAERERDEALMETARQRAIRPGSKEHWAQLGVLDGELAELLEEQKRDERANTIKYDFSPDVRFDTDDDGSWALARSGNVAFDRDDDRWPYYAAQHRRPRFKLSA